MHVTHLQSSSSSLPNIIKLSQTVKELWPAQISASGKITTLQKIVRVVSLVCNMPTGPPLHSYQKLSEYAHDPLGMANLDPRKIVGRIYVGDHYTLLHTKYMHFGPHGFREEDFFKVFPL